MSPARSRRQAQVVRRRDRMEIVKAVLVSAAIVVATALLIWLMRPGPAGVPATGGLMNRQPRASWLVFGAIVVGMIACWYIMRGSPRARRRAKTLLPVALGVVLLGAVVAGIAWPGGLLRHDVAPTAQPQPPPETTTLPTTPTTPTTTKASPTTGATGTTTPPTNAAPTAPPVTPPR